MTKRTPNPYNLVVGLLLAAVMVAAAIEPPTAYLVPLVCVAWLVVFWSYQREKRPRYRRH
jgi:Flp pilus assembly protein TadB